MTVATKTAPTAKKVAAKRSPAAKRIVPAAPKKRRGRPPGSKNKPKVTLTVKATTKKRVTKPTDFLSKTVADFEARKAELNAELKRIDVALKALKG